MRLRNNFYAIERVGPSGEVLEVSLPKREFNALLRVLRAAAKVCKGTPAYLSSPEGTQDVNRLYAAVRAFEAKR